MTEMTAQLASSLGQKLQLQKVDNRLALTLGSLKPGTPAQQRFMNPVSQTEAGRTSLLAGFEALEKALAYPAGKRGGRALARTSPEQSDACQAGRPTESARLSAVVQCRLQRRPSTYRSGESGGSHDRFA